jgi:hypothetical protein
MAATVLSSSSYLTYPDAIASPIALLNEEDEAQELLEKVASLHGSIQLDVSSSFPQEICWVPQKKKIEISASFAGKPIKTFLPAVIFELSNASRDVQFSELDKAVISKKCSKEQYITAVERCEHESLLETSEIVQAFVHNDKLPQESDYRVVMDDFDSFYLFQQFNGHTKQVEKEYHHLNPLGREEMYRGTLAQAADTYEEEIVKMIFSYKIGLLFADQTQLGRLLKSISGFQKVLESKASKSAFDRQLLLNIQTLFPKDDNAA